MYSLSYIVQGKALAASRLKRRAKRTRPSEIALPKVIFIVGATAAGKTALGIFLAQQFHGEIINADARQVYKHLTIGTGKPPDGTSDRYLGHRTYMVQGIPHYFMDFLSPNKVYTVASWRKQAFKAINGITRRDHMPIVVGGTGLYIQSMVDNYQIPSVPPQDHFRKAMESKSLDELVRLLKNVDPDAINIVDLKNRRRVIRAMEVVTFTGKPFSAQRARSAPI
ncbi:tRNA (adenosine(37)-N6)-dimethylallyltransferase MiaA, partial [Candidatus Uhrbacteria bacterium]|nr:tRNA (adenosine(37)-N6)-dimethylallyltransferase MiaA [Candidatus Uhrbacteria bacterium]